MELITRAENTAAKIARKDKDDDAEDSPKKFGATTVNAVKRSLSFVLSALKQMEQNNKVLCPPRYIAAGFAADEHHRIKVAFDGSAPA